MYYCRGALYAPSPFLHGRDAHATGVVKTLEKVYSNYYLPKILFLSMEGEWYQRPPYPAT